MMTNAATAMPAAVLWDMDGTLIDSEPYWITAESALVRRYGGTWTPEDGLTLVGRALEESATILQGRGVPLAVEEIIAELTGTVGQHLAMEIPWQPGARATLESLRDAEVPCALVTMSYEVLAQRLVESAPRGVFSGYVSGDQVVNGKPHPEAYLTGAEQLGVDITQCIAFEDSPPGITSALASGARTIAVRGQLPVPARPGLSRLASLEQVDGALIDAVMRGEVVDLLGTDE